MITNVKPIKIGEFLIRENNFGYSLILSKNLLEESKSFMVENNIVGLELNDALGWSGTDLNFLSEYPFVRHINLITKIPDTSGLSYLTNLTTLYLGDNDLKGVDTVFFENLRSLSSNWSACRKIIPKCFQLENLGIEKYNQPDLNAIQNLNSLKSLGLGNSKINSLQGICELQLLNRLSLSYCSNLSSLQEIECLKNLQFLEAYSLRSLNSLQGVENLPIQELCVEKCKIIDSFNDIGTLSELKKLVLNNVGSIQSLHFLGNLTQLEELFFIEDTSVKDGDLAPIEQLQLASLKKFSFKNRRHYSHTREELGWPECLKL